MPIHVHPRRLVLLLLVLLVPALADAGIPAEHDVYRFLRRAWLYGATGQPPPGIRPESTGELLARLADCERNRARLPAAERAELDELLNELAVYAPDDSLLPETTRWRTAFPGEGPLYSYGSHLYVVRRGQLSASFDPILSWGAIHDGEYSSDPLLRSVIGVEVRAVLGETWSAGVKFRDTAEYTQDEQAAPYSADAGYVATVSPVSGASFDETLTYLEYHNRYVDLGIGRDRHARGQSFDRSFVLSGQVPSFVYVQLRARVRPYLVFDYIHARLDPAPLPPDTIYKSESGMKRKVMKEKWFAAHRLEWTPAWWLSLGFSESVVYGERGPVLGYLIPLNLFWSENHHQSRDDNIAWGFDVRLQALDGAALYFEWVLDETSLSGILSSKLHNRTGYLVGLEAIDPLGLRGTILSIDYTKLRPFVYSHWFEINVYSHAGRSLGSPLPPNADEIRLAVTKRVGGVWEIGLFASRRRHGETPDGAEAVGGSIEELVPFRPVGRRNWTYPFLAGELTTSWHGEFSVRWEPLERVALRAVAGFTGGQGESSGLFLLEFAYNL